MNVSNRFTLYILFCALFLVSCSKNISPYKSKPEYRAAKKVAKLLARYPAIIKSDSTSKSDTVTKYITNTQTFSDATKEKAAQQTIDSILFVLEQKCPNLFESSTATPIKNSQTGNPNTSIKEKLKSICTIERLMSPITIDTAGVKITISAKGNTIKADWVFPLKEITNEKSITTVIPCPECPDKSYFKKMWAVKEVIGLLLFMFFAALFMIIAMK